MADEPQYLGEARGRLCQGERLCMAEALMEQALVTWKVCLPLSYSCWAQSGRAGCLQSYFTGHSHITKLLGSLRVSNRKANRPQSIPLFTTPCGDLKKTSRTEKGHREHTLAPGNF